MTKPLVSNHTLLAMVVPLGLALVNPAATQAATAIITASQDNTMFSGYITASNALGVLFTGRTFQGNVRRCLVAFDVAGSLPAGAVILGARLQLNVQESGPGGAQSHALHRLLEPWGEGKSNSSSENGGIATIDDTTWAYRFFPFTTWDDPGGTFDAAPSAAELIGSNLGKYSWGPTPEMNQDVQDWLDDPESSLGWIVIGNELTPLATRTFTNREAEAADLRPQLTITYEVACDPTRDLVIDAADLALLLGDWGPSPDSPADLSGNGIVDAEDLALLLGAWGPCPD